MGTHAGPPDTTARRLIRRARYDAGLTQAELARLLGVSQSVIAAYESGRRAPTVPALERIVAAIGMEISWTLRYGNGGDARLRGPIGTRLRENLDEVRSILQRAGLTDPRVVGDVATGQEKVWSTVLIVVAPTPTSDDTLLGLGGRLSLIVAARVRVTDEVRLPFLTDVDLSLAVPL
jgi:transcriptional regulator with XRE-family HTH domain